MEPQQEMAEIDVTMLLIQEARARAGEAAAALRARRAERDLIDHVERSERRLNQAFRELIDMTPGPA